MPHVVARHILTAAEQATISSGLDAYNAEATGCHDGEELGFVAEEDGALIGGAYGYTWGGICEVRWLWVKDGHRRRGLGGALLQAAIAEARARGCVHVLLTTYDFQAPDFYARHGFQKLAEIPDKPLGHTEFVMRLTLT